MPVTVKDVEHVAKLARLKFTEGEMETFTHQLNEVLAYVEKLNEIDTSNVEPLAQVIEMQNVFREDRSRPSFPRKAVLINAPEKNDEFFKVPKVIGER